MNGAARQAQSIVERRLSKSERGLFHWFRTYIHVEIVLIASCWVPYICVYEITPAKASEIFIGEHIPIRDLAIKKQEFTTPQYFIANDHSCSFIRETLQRPIWHALSHPYGGGISGVPVIVLCFWYISDNQHSCGKIFYNRWCSAVINNEIFYSYMAQRIGILCFKIFNLHDTLTKCYPSINKNIWLFEHGQRIFGNFCGFVGGVSRLFSGDNGARQISSLLISYSTQFGGFPEQASCCAIKEPCEEDQKPVEDDKQSISRLIKKALNPATFLFSFFAVSIICMRRSKFGAAAIFILGYGWLAAIIWFGMLHK